MTGYGNRTNPEPSVDSSSDTKFGSDLGSAPYSGMTEHGSGTTSGAGFGNKTGSHSESHDSTMGKLMEKAGHMMHKEGLVEKGHTKRVNAGLEEGTTQ